MTCVIERLPRHRRGLEEAMLMLKPSMVQLILKGCPCFNTFLKETSTPIITGIEELLPLYVKFINDLNPTYITVLEEMWLFMYQSICRGHVTYVGRNHVDHFTLLPWLQHYPGILAVGTQFKYLLVDQPKYIFIGMFQHLKKSVKSYVQPKLHYFIIL